MNRYEKRRQAIDRAIREQIDEYKGIYNRADQEDRDPSDEERLDIESHLKAIETLKAERQEVEANIKTIEHVQHISDEIGPALGQTSVTSEPHDRARDALAKAMPLGPADAYGVSDLGRQFVDSAGYKDMIRTYKETGRLPDGATSGPVSLQTKGTLAETAAAGWGGGAGLIPSPQVIPGTVQKLFQRLTVADLFLPGQTTTNSLRYVTEGTATSGAAGVAEVGTKPESALGFATVDEPVKKIATLLPVSEEMLADAPAIQAYINGRLTLFVQIEEERQLIRGTSGGAEVQGLLTSRNVPVYAGGTAAGNIGEQLFKGANSMRGSALIEPEWVVMHPSDWEKLRLLKDSSGQLYGGGPFVGPYGVNGQADQSGQVTGARESVWNLPVVVTSAPGAGTAIVGSRANGQVWRRGGITVEASNSHSTYFALNLVAIRAEERLGLAVYRAGGYVETRLA